MLSTGRKESGEEDDRSELLRTLEWNARAPESLPRYGRWVLACLIISVLLLSNVVTWVQLSRLRQDKAARPSFGDAPLVDEYWTTFSTYTNYSSNDISIANKAWNQYTINGFVALPHAWATNKQWPKARDMPGDTDKGIYVVDGFHQLHCLMSIRDTVAELLEGGGVENRTHVLHHLNHCYDALRQAIICRADDTPLYVPKQTFFAGDGQQRRCKSWQSLEDWVIRHTACYDPVRC